MTPTTTWLLLLAAAVVFASRHGRAATLARGEAERIDRAGRDGERTVALELARLPRDYVVLHDVRMISDRWWRVRGGNARSAQIDHLVVGPCGVVIVETKQWSAGFSESRASWTASDQADRASDLCWRVLAAAGLKCPVVGVVAYTTARPHEPNGSRVRVRHVSELLGTIRGLPTRTDARQTEQVAAFVASRFACRKTLASIAAPRAG